MTISPLQRPENVEAALRLMLAELGEQGIAVVFFNPRSDAFKDVLPTTWAELRDERWLGASARMFAGLAKEMCPHHGAFSSETDWGGPFLYKVARGTRRRCNPVLQTWRR